jgi:DNA polymerase-3 subunit delta
LKLDARGSASFCRGPDAGLSGALLFGQEEGLVATRRRELVEALLGPAADPLRLTRLDAAAVRRDPAALDAALRTRGFFAERSVVLVEGATDAVAGALGPIVDGMTRDDAFLIVTAGALPARSSLLGLFGRARHLAAVAVAAEAPTVEEVEARLRGLGLRSGLEPGATAELAMLAAAMDPACFDRFLETVAIHSLGLTRPLGAAEIALLAPSGRDAELDAFVDGVAGGRPESVGPLLRRVMAAGANPVTLLLGLQRHFRQLMLAESGAPVWGARRDTVRAQSLRWRRDRLELAARLLYATDARVRSAERVPAMALVERCAIRLAMLAEG